MVMFCSVQRWSVFMFGGVVWTGLPSREVGGWSYASSHASTVNVGEVPWLDPNTLDRVLAVSSRENGAAASLFGRAPRASRRSSSNGIRTANVAEDPVT